MLLAAPYLVFLTDPAVGTAAAIGFVASIGYAASLPLQERLVTHTDPAARGQVLGVSSTTMMAMQGVGAVAAGRWPRPWARQLLRRLPPRPSWRRRSS
jgi:predicted MFS family arabinose efflux permease